MDKGLAWGLTLRTLGFAAALFASDFALNRCSALWRGWNVDPSFLFKPTLALSATLYSASILSFLLSGELSNAVVSNVKVLAAALFLYMVFANAPTPQALQPLGVWVLAGTLAVVAARVAASISKHYGGTVLKTLVESLCIFSLAHVLSSAARVVVDASNIEFVKQAFLPEKIYISVLAVSALSALGVFNNCRNPYLSYFGGKFSRGASKLSCFITVMLLLFYFSNLRPAASSLIPNYIVVMEWAAVCLTAYAFYSGVRGYASKRLTEEMRLGGWTVHVQKIFHEKGSVVEASKSAEDFVELGLKAGLLSHIVAALVENGVPPGKIEFIIQELADYEDQPIPKLTLKWELKNLEVEGKRRRLNVLASTLAKASDQLGLAGLAQTVEGEVEGGKV
jgi:hypothetical protein